MKKPKIIIKNNAVSEFPVVNGEVKSIYWMKEVNEEMIDALIESRDTLVYLGSFKDTSTVKQVNIVEKALKKAGVTDL